MSAHPFRRFCLRILGLLALPATTFAQSDRGIILLEPVGGVGTVQTTGNEGLGVFRYYFFDLLYPWVIGMGAATAVLMAVWGGIQIIQAGSDQAKVTEGKNRLLISLGGLLIILLSATILNALNPVFFR